MTYKEIDTIQKQEKLNRVYRVGRPGPGGAYHNYAISGNNIMLLAIEYQEGPRKDPTSRPGVLDCDLLEVVRDRLTCFQAGEYACEYNQEALEHVEAALKALNRRVEDRIERGVLGKNKK